MLVYEFNTSHTKFTQNEHVKLIKTCLDTQGLFKAHLLNVMDVLEHLTSKHLETLNTTYMHNINYFKDHKTSYIIHNYTKLHIRHLGDLVVKCLGHPLTFDFQCT